MKVCCTKPACYFMKESYLKPISKVPVCALAGGEASDDALEVLLALADEAAVPELRTCCAAGTKRPVTDSSAPASKRGRTGDVFGALRQPAGVEERQAARAAAAVDRGGAPEKFSGLQVRLHVEGSLKTLAGLQ